MLYEGVAQWGAADRFSWYIREDAKGNLLQIWPMHPALTRAQAMKQGDEAGNGMHAV